MEDIVKLGWLKKKEQAYLAALEIAQECQGRLRERSAVAVQAIVRAAKNPSERSRALIERESAELGACTLCLERVESTVEELSQRRREIKASAKTLAFATSTIAMAAVHRTLHEANGGLERLVFWTGPTTPDGTRVLSSIVKVKLSQQSPTYVLADPEDCNRKMVLLREHLGHERHAIAHSHIGNGAALARASSVDIEAQRRNEAIGGNSIGVIVTTDCHFAFFSVAIPFEISITGNGVALVSSNPWRKVFRLEMGGE